MTPDDDQRAVIDAPEGARLLVTAGPGAGKTAVIVERLRSLIDSGLDRHGDILVVSFSRAAVGVVTSRLTGIEEADVVEVRTLDSLAAAILDEEGIVDWERMGFDARIRRAVQLLHGGTRPFSADVGHLVVDEVQDIVGDRADLVLSLLRALEPEAGFTLLGDPLQGIYDFQLGPRGGTGWKALVAAVTGELGGTEVRLHGDYRSQDEQIRRIVAMRDELRRSTSPATQALTLTRALSGVPHAGAVEQFARLAPRWQGTSAVLTWTNGEALAVWDMLWEAGVAARLQRRADEIVLAPWLADVLAEVTDPVDETQFDELVAGRAAEVPEGAWEALRRAAGGYGHRLDPGSLARRLLRSDPPPLLEVPPAGIVVSTVHRAKGLEFDNVVLVDPASRLSPARRPEAQTVREAYVAMTRGRARLAVADWTREVRLKKDPRSERWYVPGFEKWQTRAFEIRGGDTAVPAPSGDEGRRAQALLRDDVGPGEKVDLEIVPRLSLEIPTYDVRRDGDAVGRTNAELGEALAARVRMRQAGRPWPDLRDARVEGVETRVDPRGAESGSWFWKNVRVAGMARLEW